MSNRSLEIAEFENNIDVLISCISFEARCLAMCKYLKAKGIVKEVILYRNLDVSVYNSSEEKTDCDILLNKHYSCIKEHLDTIGVPFILFESKHRNIEEKLKKIAGITSLLEETAKREGGINCIAVDATCFTRIDLLIILDHLYDHFPKTIIRIIYTRPEDHAKDWLTRGYSGIDSILGFAGRFDYLKKNILVILSGFEEERPRNFIDEYEADLILFGSSSNNPTKLEFGERTKAIQEQFLRYEDNVIPFSFAANSIYGCFHDMETVLAPYWSDYNIVIAPLCTKLSVVATFLLAKKYPQIQLAYCYPKEYNWKNYSTGMEEVYIEDIKRIERDVK